MPIEPNPMTDNILSNEKKKHLRKIGHELKPVITIGDNGLSETVVNELNRALDDHELIKVKLRVDDKAAMKEEICAASHALLVQSIGNILLLFRAAKKPNPKLSNLLR